MLKYKKKRFVRTSLAVFIPLFLGSIIFAAFNHYKKIDFEDISLVSKTKNIFYSSDKVASKNAKMAEANINKKTELSTDTNVISSEEDSTSAIYSEMEQIGLESEDFYDIDTLNIQKDAMIAKKVYSIPIDSKAAQLDSLLMNRTSPIKNYFFTLEFWLSPVRFNGYKRSANKAVIYGITDTQNAELQIVGYDYYLIVNNNFYLLMQSNSFLNLIQQNPK